MARGPTFSSQNLEKRIAFHGHICPGLGVESAGDEELLAFVENDACGAGAI